MNKLTTKSLTSAYAMLMEEIKERRDAAITTLAKAHHTNPPYNYLDIEFCYLQVRRICEILAIAALIAHNEIDSFRANKFIKAWNADDLFTKLASVNTTAFPRAARFEAEEEAGVFVATIENEGYLTREAFTQIYHQCSAGLHAGTLKRLLDYGPKQYNVKDVISWLDEIVRLLNIHVVVLPNGKMMSVEMIGGYNGSVICHLDDLELH